MPTKSKPASTPRKAAPARNPAASAKRRVKPAPAPQPTGTKQSQLIALLRSPQGTSIEAMTSATGWQPHTVRGTISGVLRKRLGLNVTCTAEAGSRTYRIVEAA